MSSRARCLAALVLVLTAQPTAVLARYCATGHVQGSVCRGFVIEKCSMKTIAAVKGADGSLHRLPGCFDQVSDFKAGRCWISTKARSGGLLGWGINIAAAPDFYTRGGDGKLERAGDVDYLTFPCIRR